MVGKLFPDLDPLITSRVFEFRFGYTLRLLGLILKDSLIFFTPLLIPKWQVPTSLKCDLTLPRPGSDTFF